MKVASMLFFISYRNKIKMRESRLNSPFLWSDFAPVCPLLHDASMIKNIQIIFKIEGIAKTYDVIAEVALLTG